jgi:hypothetical protein
MTARALGLRAIDPHDLRTWHCLDDRLRDRHGGDMGQREIASDYIRARTDLITAKKVLADAENKKAACEAGVRRTEGNLNELFIKKQSFTNEASENDFALAAIAVARAISELRTADLSVTEARDHLTAATEKVDSTFETLVATFPKVG